jgi:hypothetical protein
VVLVVSEETGADEPGAPRSGVFRNLGTGELRARLNEWLLAPAPNAASTARKAEAAAR